MTRPAPLTAPLVLALALAACVAEPRRADAPQPSATTRPAAATPAASSQPPHSSAPAQADATPALAIEAEGLRLFDRTSGAARPLPFGTDWRQLRRALAFRGPPGEGTNSECGAGPLDYASWPDGLTLYAQRGRFAGWALDGRGEGAITTAAGIGPGSTRAQLTDAYAARFTQTTLGLEFSAGEIFGLLDKAPPGGKVTNMWAGTSCNFR